MSNVLIGIIGVILFIGLALAGALFLGPRFQDATVNSKAASLQQAMSQLSQAANMYEVQEGRRLRASDYATNTQKLIDGRYLKSPAMYGTTQVYTVDQDGYGRDLPVDHVQVIVGAENDKQARSVCMEIERFFGSKDLEASMAPVTTSDGWGARVAQRRAGGCFLYAAINPAQYAAYMSI